MFELLSKYELPEIDPPPPPFEVSWSGGKLQLEGETLSVRQSFREVHLTGDRITIRAFGKLFVIEGGAVTAYDEPKESEDDIEF